MAASRPSICALSQEVQNQAAEVALRARRRAGELIAEMPKQAGARGVGKKVDDHAERPLSDIGVSQNQSTRWQAIATIPEEKFETFIAETLTRGRELTTASTGTAERPLAIAGLGDSLLREVARLGTTSGGP